MFEEGMSSNELLDEYRLDLADIQEKTVRFDRSEERRVGKECAI